MLKTAREGLEPSHPLEMYRLAICCLTTRPSRFAEFYKPNADPILFKGNSPFSRNLSGL